MKRFAAIELFKRNKPRVASPRPDYVRSEEDGISTNRII